MMFLSNWLNGFRRIGRLHISTSISGPAVNFGQNVCAMHSAAQRRCRSALHFDGEHYVTLSPALMRTTWWRVFDPYYLDQPLDTDGVQMMYDHPCEYNRSCRAPCFERETHEVYALGEIDTREAILLFNDSDAPDGREYHRIYDLTPNGGTICIVPPF